MADTRKPVQTFDKDPGEKLPYTMDWNDATRGPWLPDGETIDTSEWEVTTGLTNVSDSKSSTSTQIVLSGGTADESYYAVNTVTTTPSGWIGVRSIKVNVVER